MEKKMFSQEGQNDLRQYACLRKYEKIVNQFGEMMEMVDAITKPPKRRRISSSKRKKSTSVAAACKDTLTMTSISAAANDITTGKATSNPEAVEAEVSADASLSKPEKLAALEQIMTKHLNDLQTDCDWEFAKN